MTDRTIPTATLLAARRGFIRTTAQAYAAALPLGGLNAGVLLALLDLPTLVIVLTIGSWLISPIIAGAISFLSIVGDGVPDEYTRAGYPARDPELGL